MYGYPPPNQPNPYAPPQGYIPAMPGAVAGDPTGTKPWVTWAYLATLVVSISGFTIGFALFFFGIALEDEDRELAGTLTAIGGLSLGVAFLLFYVKLALALVWVHSAWSWLPFEYRFLNNGNRVTPGSAAGFLVIPYFNLYWMFVMNTGLCSALERLRANYAVHGEEAPRNLAVGGAVCQLIPLCNLLVAPIVWFLYMRNVDKLRMDFTQRMIAR
jgi:hypothetical protein